MWQQIIHSKGLMTVDLLQEIFKRVTNCDVILLSYEERVIQLIRGTVLVQYSSTSRLDDVTS